MFWIFGNILCNLAVQAEIKPGFCHLGDAHRGSQFCCVIRVVAASVYYRPSDLLIVQTVSDDSCHMNN